MTTNLEIMSFLKATQDTQAKEKEEDRKIRARERQEDMEHILAMVQRGVQKEVRAAIQPLEDRLEVQEKASQELSKQFDSVLREMDLLKETVKNQQEFPALKVSVSEQSVQGAVGFQGVWNGAGGRWERRSGDVDRRPGREDDYTVGRQEMCAAARRVVGFTPIEPRMLELQIQSYGAKDLEEAKRMEIESYLKCEMKMKPSDIQKLEMVRIFSPAKEDWNVLYVEFGSDYQVDMVFSHTRNMVKQDHRVVRWYPRQMYERYRAVESIAYDLRRRLKLKTRVKIGRNDIELNTRETASTVWRRHVLPDSLPKFEMADFRPVQASSPPPGRPGRGQGLAAALDEIDSEKAAESDIVDREESTNQN
jgi:hypothetical protein